MSAGRVRLVDVPPVDFAGKKVSVGNSRIAAVEFEASRAEVAPARIVLIVSVVFAAHLDRVFAVDQRQHVGKIVNAFAEYGVNVAVSSSAAQNSGSLACPLVNRNSGEKVSRCVRAVRRLETQSGWIILAQRVRFVGIELAHG